MATNFPTSLDALTNPSGTDSMSSPSHAGQHTDANDAIEALQAKVGIDGSAVTSSLDFRTDALETATTDLQTDVTNINEIQLNAQTGTTYTLVLADGGKVVSMSNSSANTLTVPPTSSVAFPQGTQILVIQQGSGQTSIAAGAGVTINSKDGNLKLSARYCGATLIKRGGTDQWWLLGDLSA